MQRARPIRRVLPWVLLVIPAAGLGAGPREMHESLVPPAPGAPHRAEMIQEARLRQERGGAVQAHSLTLLNAPFPREKAAGPVAHPSPPFTKGALRFITLLGQFPSGSNASYDAGYSTTVNDYFQKLFFGSLSPAGDHWTLHNYLYDASYGILPLAGDVYGPYTVSQPYSYYAAGNAGLGGFPTNSAQFAQEVVSLHCQANPNFSWGQYDQSGALRVDMVIVVHPGPGSEASGNPGDFRSKFSTMTLDTGAPITVSGTSAERVDSYSVAPEYEWVPRDGVVGVHAWTVLENFNMVDLSNSSGSCDGGAGDWSIMGSGLWLPKTPTPSAGVYSGQRPSLPDPWSTNYLQWFGGDPVVVPLRNASDVPVAPREFTPGTTPTPPSLAMVYRIWTDGNASSPEYFLLEHRRQIGWDQFLPAEGALIWHVDEPYFYFGFRNNNCSHPFDAVMEADAGYNLNILGINDGQGFNMRMTTAPQKNHGDAGDPFPGSTGNQEFSLTTWPSSRAYANNADTLVSIRNFRTTSEGMLFDLSLQSSQASRCPSKPTVWPVPFAPARAPGRALHYGPVPRGARFSLYTIAGEQVGSTTAATSGCNAWSPPALAHGLYSWIISPPTGSATTGALAVIQ